MAFGLQGLHPDEAKLLQDEARDTAYAMMSECHFCGEGPDDPDEYLAEMCDYNDGLQYHKVYFCHAECGLSHNLDVA